VVAATAVAAVAVDAAATKPLTHADIFNF
jgi:hypothetical protein